MHLVWYLPGMGAETSIQEAHYRIPDGVPLTLEEHTGALAWLQGRGAPQAGSDAAAELLQGLGGDLGECQGGLREVHEDAADALALRRRVEVAPCGLLQLSAQLAHVPAPEPGCDQQHPLICDDRLGSLQVSQPSPRRRFEVPRLYVKLESRRLHSHGADLGVVEDSRIFCSITRGCADTFPARGSCHCLCQPSSCCLQWQQSHVTCAHPLMRVPSSYPVIEILLTLLHIYPHMRCCSGEAEHDQVHKDSLILSTQ